MTLYRWDVGLYPQVSTIASGCFVQDACLHHSFQNCRYFIPPVSVYTPCIRQKTFFIDTLAPFSLPLLFLPPFLSLLHFLTPPLPLTSRNAQPGSLVLGFEFIFRGGCGGVVDCGEMEKEYRFGLRKGRG